MSFGNYNKLKVWMEFWEALSVSRKCIEIAIRNYDLPALGENHVMRNRYDTFLKIWQPFMESVETIPPSTVDPLERLNWFNCKWYNCPGLLVCIIKLPVCVNLLLYNRKFQKIKY